MCTPIVTPTLVPKGQILDDDISDCESAFEFNTAKANEDPIVDESDDDDDVGVSEDADDSGSDMCVEDDEFGYIPVPPSAARAKANEYFGVVEDDESGIPPLTEILGGPDNGDPIDFTSLRIAMHFPQRARGLILTSMGLDQLETCDNRSIVWASFTILTMIDLSNNRLRKIPEELVKYTPQMEIVDMSHNQIATVKSLVWNRWPNLKELDLSHNRIASITSGKAYRLQRLNLSNQSRVLRRKRKDANSNAGEVVVPSLEIHTKDHYFFALPSAVSINMSNCHMAVLPAFASLRFLTELDLSRNNLENLEAKWECAPLLEKLNVSGNQITEIPASLTTKCARITHLNLANNRLVEGLDALQSLPGLVSLDLSHNAIVSLPPTLDTCPANCLQKLDLSWNSNLQELTQWVQKMPVLRELDVSGTSLFSIPRSPAPWRGL
jgi:Leucine-rich repeat (LRR) protein